MSQSLSLNASQLEEKGLFFLNNRKFSEAQAFLIVAASLNEEAAREALNTLLGSLLNLGWSYHANGNLDEAERTYRRCLYMANSEVEPDRCLLERKLHILVNMTDLLCKQGKFWEAADLAKDAIGFAKQCELTNSPQYAYIFGNLAEALEKQERYASARLAYQDYIEILGQIIPGDQTAMEDAQQALADVTKREAEVQSVAVNGTLSSGVQGILSLEEEPLPFKHSDEQRQHLLNLLQNPVSTPRSEEASQPDDNNPTILLDARLTDSSDDTQQSDPK